MDFTRREFVKCGALTGAGLFLAGFPGWNSAQRPLRVGCIGSGAAGLSHLRAAAAAGTARVMGICDPNEINRRSAVDFCAAALKERPFACADHTQLLTELPLDLAVIATPNEHHLAPALAALQSRVGVLLESLPVSSGDDLASLSAAASQSGSIVRVSTPWRMNSGVQVARDWMRSGEIGEFRSAQIACVGPTLRNGRRVPGGAPELGEAGVSFRDTLFSGTGFEYLDTVFWITGHRGNGTVFSFAHVARRKAAAEETARLIAGIKFDCGEEISFQYRYHQQAGRVPSPLLIQGARGSICFDAEGGVACSRDNGRCTVVSPAWSNRDACLENFWKQLGAASRATADSLGALESCYAPTTAALAILAAAESQRVIRLSIRS